MKRTVYIALSLVVILTSACKKDENKETAAVQESRETKLENQAPNPGLNLSNMRSIGNHTYIPLNMTDSNPVEILQVLDTFEKSYPYLEVTDWKIEKQQTQFAEGNKIFGLWIDHKMK